MKPVFALILALALTLTPFVCFAVEDGTVQEGDFTYAIENGEATVTAYGGSGGAVVIPAATEGGCAGLIIAAPRGSCALNYANSHGIQAVAVEP